MIEHTHIAAAQKSTTFSSFLKKNTSNLEPKTVELVSNSIKSYIKQDALLFNFTVYRLAAVEVRVGNIKKSKMMR